MKDKIEVLGERLIKKETEICNEIQKKQEELKKIKEPLLIQSFILKEILPLKISGLLIMDKLNLIKSLEYFDLTIIDEKLADLAATADKLILNEWDSIKKIINDQSKILEELSKIK